jgi:hypothetical protein
MTKMEMREIRQNQKQDGTKERRRRADIDNKLSNKSKTKTASQ